MSIYTVFTTPGELDLRSITTFGMHAKVIDNPIGHFGTGLKNTIAILLKLGIPISIFTGGSEYKFYTKSETFRDKEFQTCRYRKTGLLNKFSYHELPYTTELGKDWELWQAFRELMSNTLDENGDCEVTDTFGMLKEKFRLKDHTYIVVEGQAFADVVAKKDEIFLPKDKLKLVASSKDVEIYEGSSRYLYFRGLRAYDLKSYEKETMYTYNYIGNEAGLTEDRTIKSIWYVQYAIANLVAKSEDRKLIGSLMKPADRYWEKALEYTHVYSKSQTFDSVVYRMGSSPASSYMPSSARTYYSDVLEPTRNPVFKVPEVSDTAWKYMIETIQQLHVEGNPFEYQEALTDVIKALESAFDRRPPAFEVVMVPKDQPVVIEGDDIPF